MSHLVPIWPNLKPNLAYLVYLFFHSRWKVTRDGRFGSKAGQIGPKWDKFGAFSGQISEHLLKNYLKSPGFIPFRANLAYFRDKSAIPERSPPHHL